MFQKEINVLAVDDEPDVLSVTKLALRDMKVGGLPLRVHTARSKAEDRAAERRLAHGVSRAERDRAAADRDKARQTLDQHRIEPGDRR